jgi:glycosyltransferase involved in cell wall biosynthesis
MPLVSCVIITHNRARYIKEAIVSVLAQDFKDLELIIVDDASTDNTPEIVQPFLSDERVRYFPLLKQPNIAAVRNFANRQARGKYVAVLDSDDFWCDPQKLTRQYEFLENHPAIVMAGSSAIIIDPEGKAKRLAVKPSSDADIKKVFLLKNPFFHSSLMYRKDAITALGGYDEKLKYCDDFDLWLRLNEHENFYNFPDFFIKYREHDDNESVKNFWRAVREVMFMLLHYRKKFKVSFSVFGKKIWQKAVELIKR